MKRWILAFVLLGCGACTRDPIVARVGEFKIRAQDAKYRDAVIKIYYPQDNRALGLEQLVQAYTLAQVLKNKNHPVTDEILRGEEKRIDEHTQAPAMLASIKAIFGTDSDAYRRDFILPTYVRHALYDDVFLHDKHAQDEAKRKALAVLNDVLASPPKFAKLANIKRATISGDLVKWDGVSDDAGPGPSADLPPTMRKTLAERFAAAQKEQADLVRQAVQSAHPKAGDVLPGLFEHKENWWLVRYLGPAKNGLRIETVSLPKASFSDWLSAESDKVKRDIGAANG